MVELEFKSLFNDDNINYEATKNQVSLAKTCRAFSFGREWDFLSRLF